jgi:hypothetical protein
MEQLELTYTAGRNVKNEASTLESSTQFLRSLKELLPILIKLYWNMLVLIHLHIIFGCFCAITAKLNDCNRLQYTYYIAPYGKFAEPWPKHANQ